METAENFLENYQLEGDSLKIFTWPSAVLKEVAGPVESFDDELRETIKNMLFTMYSAPGIGLAAPQIGLSKRIFVMDIDFDREEVTKADGESEFRLSNFNPRVFINPVISQKEGEVLYEEGCLSVPGIYEEVKRAESIVVDYFDAFGNPQQLEASEILSICIQHENDHLDGVVFLERLSMIKRNFLTKKYMKNKKKA
ncbi:MAG: peptide deformylase [Bacteriovoracaceae bacterium]|nr:peptide deformylase [Bacteriovoracaceae bacterium]